MSCRHCGSLKHSGGFHNDVVNTCKHLRRASLLWRNVFADEDDFTSYQQLPGAVCWSESDRCYIGIAGDGKKVLLPATPEQCELFLETRPNPIDW